MSTLTNKDYTKILEYYNISLPKSKRILKQKAEKILAEKLCKCIKKIDPINEAKSIGICTKTIINNKGFTRGNFQCKKKQTITLKKIVKKNKNSKTAKIKSKSKK
jgi:hypothetical protein